MEINPNQICSISKRINDICYVYYYHSKDTKICFFWKHKAGFYRVCFDEDDGPLTKEEIESEGELVIRGEKVYYKPHLIIKMCDGNKYEKYFETKEELEAYYNELIKEIKIIKL